MTDESGVYHGIGQHFADHETVNHCDPRICPRATSHTNTIEGFFSIFKRGMTGRYQHCGEQHLHRYLAEFDFRYSQPRQARHQRRDARRKGLEGHRRQAPHLSADWSSLRPQNRRPALLSDGVKHIRTSECLYAANAVGDIYQILVHLHCADTRIVDSNTIERQRRSRRFAPSGLSFLTFPYLSEAGHGNKVICRWGNNAPTVAFGQAQSSFFNRRQNVARKKHSYGRNW